LNDSFWRPDRFHDRWFEGAIARVNGNHVELI